MDIVDDFAHSDDAEPIRNAIDRIINRKRVNTIIECRFLCKNGSWKWIQLTMSLFGETDMPPQFIICLIDDISEKKAIQEALARSEFQLRELSGELVKVEERERNRVSMELHDSIGGNLTGIKYMLEKMLIQPILSPDSYRESLCRLETQVLETLDEVHRISSELYPRVLSDLGLLPAIRWMVRKHNQVYSDIVTKANIGTIEPKIPDDLKIIVFRLLQEALNNAAKHSGAKSITVDFTVTDKKLMLRIQDDGCGFSAVSILRPGSHKGMGLRNMIKRAELTGGLMRIESTREKGTCVYMEWSFPIGQSGDTSPILIA